MEVCKEHLEINKFNLNNECVKQPSLYEFYAEQLAEAKEAKDKASNKLELIEAQSQLAFREECAAKGTKVTEAIVNAHVICDPDVISAKEALSSAIKIMNVLQGAVNAMEQKCSMIQTLQRMQSSQSYNVEPKFDGKETSEYVEKVLNSQLNNPDLRARLNGAG